MFEGPDVVHSLGWSAWLTAGVIVAVLAALVKEVARPDLVFLGGLGVLLLAGVLSPEEAFAGFANSAVLTVGALFVVAAGVQHTQALSFGDRFIFSQSGSLRRVLLRLMASTSFASAFLNNTPLVAMLAPRVQQWARHAGIPASRLMIPLSYAAILGGMMTLIGTSTNIVVSGLMRAEGYGGLGMFDLTGVGLPVALCAVLYLALLGYRLLPDRGGKSEGLEEGLKECLFEVRVASPSPLVGQTVEEAGLRSLGDAYLAHVRRQGRLVPATPGETLQAGDILTFVGNTVQLERLLQRPGLHRVVEAVDPGEELTLPLYEAVVAESSRLVGKTLRDVHFREHYGGVVLGIQRRNEQISEPLGRLPIKAGDLMLVEARNGFDQRWNASRDEFYLVAPHRSSRPRPQTRKAPLALLILAAMVLAIATGVVSTVTAAFTAALAMVATRCLPGSDARRAVDIPVLVVIAAALGIGHAADETGLAGVLAYGLVGMAAGGGAVVVLLALYAATALLTELVREPSRVLSRVFQFLGVEDRPDVATVDLRKNPGFLPRSILLQYVAQSLFGKGRFFQTVKRFNRRALPGYPPMAPEMRHYLEAYFEEPNQRLAALSGLDVSCWQADSQGRSVAIRPTTLMDR